MFFALGAFTAGLLMLLIAPAFWRRTVRLTRRDIEATVPMSMVEARAARDQLRAEYAVETRRLEIARSALSDKVTRQQFEITEGREIAKSLGLERDEKLRMLAEGEQREQALRDELRRKEEDLSRITARMRDTEADLKRRSQQFVELSQKLGERAARGSAALEGEEGASREIARLESEIAGQKARQTADAAKILSLEGELSELRRRYASLEDSRSPVTGSSPRNGAATDTVIQKLENLVIDLEGRNVEAQAEIARLSLQMEALRGLDGDNSEGALQSLEAENNALAEELNRITVERGRLESQLRKTNQVRDTENAALREEMTDLAARLAAITADAEGEGSAIDQILSAEAKSRNGHEGASLVNAPTGRRNGAANPPRTTAPSLADRIRGFRKSGQASPTTTKKSETKPASVTN